MRLAAVLAVALWASAGAWLALATISKRAPLAGLLEIRGATIVDAPPEEPRDTHAAVVLRGDGARLLYEALKVEPTKDECFSDGSLRKQIGGIKCVRLATDQTYECDFAINLREQKIEVGRVC